MATNPPLPASITIAQVTKLLEVYPGTITSLSKAAKNPDETLESLDTWYRTQLPETIKSRGEEAHLLKSEVGKIVAYKLKRGKFRPSLMGLASALDSNAVNATSVKAFKLLSDSTPTTEQIISGVKELSMLKGIGPATASYLLAAFKPDDVPIFSDEAFRWIFFESGAGKGWDRKIKYDLKEYTQFVGKMKEVTERLKVKPSEVEKVGFVLGKGALVNEERHGNAVEEKDQITEKKEDTTENNQVKVEVEVTETPATKRKRATDDKQTDSSKEATTKQTKRLRITEKPAKEIPSSGRITRSRTKSEK